MTDTLTLMIASELGHLQDDRGQHAANLAQSRVARVARRAHKLFRQLHERKERLEARDRLLAKARLYRKKAA